MTGPRRMTGHNARPGAVVEVVLVSSGMCPLDPDLLITARAFRYHSFVPTDSHITGDVIAQEIRRVSGEPGSTDGLIEIPLFGHRHRYRVRIDTDGAAPRLVELHLLSDDDAAEIDPATVRQIPIRRLAKAAARFIVLGEGWPGPVVDVGELHDPTLLARPDRPPNGGRGRKLDDVHYRQVAAHLIRAREIGESPREYVADKLGGSLPTVDRWIKEAKKRNFLMRDWATAADPQPAHTD